jgi:3-oxoacyl-[acyl-carrier protein] reductase
VSDREPRSHDQYRDLEGRTALVTGAGRNNGRAIALELATKGANVVINARSNTDEAQSVRREVESLGAEALVIMGDVSEQETIDDLKQKSEERFGIVDIVVSNAAIRPYQSFFDMSPEDFVGILNVQLIASFRLAKAFVPAMAEQHWGRIIHITGPDAMVGWSHRAHNVVAKGGLRALTKALAIELGEFGITVNDVAPGAMLGEGRTNPPTTSSGGSMGTDTHPRLTQGRARIAAPATSRVPDDLPDPRSDPMERLIGQIPVGRLGDTRELAYAVGFLASPRAGFYTGIVVPCFGGHFLPA